MTTKRCPRCGDTKALDQFGRRRAASGNIVATSKCRPCASAAARASYRPDRSAESFKRRYAADPARFAAYGRTQRAKMDGPARGRAWRADNPDWVREYARRYAAENASVRAEWQRRREARKRGATVVPFTRTQLIQRLSMFSGCWICGGGKETVDHVKPLAAGGLHVLANMRPACRSCNSRKRSTWPFRV